MSFLVVLYSILGITMCIGEETVLLTLIDNIFNATEENVTQKIPSNSRVVITSMPISETRVIHKQCGVNKKCVPYFLCKNNTIIKDGTGIIDIRIDNSECSYLDACCSFDDEVKTPIVYTPKQKEGCGYQNINGIGFKISGNKNNEAQFAEFPWMSAILSEERYSETVLNIYKCGSSLIGLNVVLTAAHCVQNSSPGSIKVRVGEWDTQSESEILPFQERRGVEIVIHPLFDNGSLVNDVALVFVDINFEYAENVKPLCLPFSDGSLNFSSCFATGWGKNEFGKKGKYQVILKKIDLSILPNNQCQDNLRTTRLGKHFDLHQSFLCAGGEHEKDTCKGDGGSPLFCRMHGTSNRFGQAGIVAWGIGCGELGVPGVYANVSYLRSWIDAELKKKGVETSGLFL